MKLRVGLVSSDRNDTVRLTKDFPDLLVTHGKNIIEFVQFAAGKKLDAILFWGANLNQEFHAIHAFLRSKPAFRETPLAILTANEEIFQMPVQDPLARNFCFNKDGLFLLLMRFFETVAKPKSMQELIAFEAIQKSFSSALTEFIGDRPDFSTTIAIDDDLHAEFQAQLSDEIATNLLWLKFSARILERNSEKLVSSLKTMSETEGRAYQEELLRLTLKKFGDSLWHPLREQGAMQFLTTDSLPPAARLPFLKRAVHTGLLFQSEFCEVVLEVSRYI